MKDAHCIASQHSDYTTGWTIDCRQEQEMMSRLILVVIQHASCLVPRIQCLEKTFTPIYCVSVATPPLRQMSS